MQSIMQMLAGRKTYAIGILMIALGILQEDKEMIMEGLAFCFLRAGLNKV